MSPLVFPAVNHATSRKSMGPDPRTAAFGLVILVSACGKSPALVTDFNGNSVTVQVHSLESVEYQKQVASAEAQRICSKVGKNAEYASTRGGTHHQDYNAYHLYLCL